ncbi:MAG: hypothetical protein K8I02_10300 [Candidatus Methylomirabilis sp.]|nr:hypothetical protein [Deltaproteobacteria bacterium]
MARRIATLRRALEKTEDYLAQIAHGVKEARKAKRWDRVELFLAKEDELHHVIQRYEAQMKAARKLPEEFRKARAAMPKTADLSRKSRAAVGPVGHLRGRHGPIQPQKSRYAKRVKRK